MKRVDYQIRDKMFEMELPEFTPLGSICYIPPLDEIFFTIRMPIMDHIINNLHKLKSINYEENFN